MSEQVTDPQGQEPKGEPQQTFAGKFKSAEELEKGYLELQKKLGDRRNSEPPKQEPPAATSDEYEWQKKNAALDAKEAVIKKRKDEAAEALSDGDTLSAVRRALGSTDAVNQFQKEFDAGDVSASEVRRLATLGKGVKESTQTLPEPNKDADSDQLTQDESAYYFQQLKNPNSPYNNTFSPEHKQARVKMAAIRQKLGL